MQIRDLAYDNEGNVKSPWRADLQEARLGDAYFYCEADAIENGRRIVMHEFPKKNLPYAEDMGRRAYEFTVRGYCIQYPRDQDGDASQLRRRDYRIARNILAAELSSGEPRPLYLPTGKGLLTDQMMVMCPRYRLTEEDRSGGYCVFDMTFVELGAPPREPPPNPRDELIGRSQDLREQIVRELKAGTGATTGATIGV